MSRPRALFVIPTMHVGGAQRVFTNLLNGLIGHGIELHLAAVLSEGPFRNQLSPEIKIHTLRGGRVFAALPSLWSLIHRLRPDAVVTTAFSMNLGAMLMRPLLPRQTRFLIREVSLFDSQVPGGWRGSVLTFLAARAFRAADGILCQSEFMATDLQQSLGLSPSPMRTIFNPVCFDELVRQAAGSNPFPPSSTGPHILAVGRLEPAKGFDRLLSAFPELCKRRPGAQLWIVGEGMERQALVRQAAQLGISSGVHFAGFEVNPYRWMKHAHLMVVPSRREGAPNSVLEAIACECPLVVLDHPGGTREMMSLAGQEWRIVSDLSCWDDSWFTRPSPSVLHRARQLFAIDVIARQYLKAMELPIGDAAGRPVTSAAA